MHESITTMTPPAPARRSSSRRDQILTVIDPLGGQVADLLAIRGPTPRR